MGRRRGEIALMPQHGGQVVVRLGQIGPQSKRLPIVCHGLVRFALLVSDVAQAVVCLEELGLESHGRSSWAAASSSWPWLNSTLPRLLWTSAKSGRSARIWR